MTAVICILVVFGIFLGDLAIKNYVEKYIPASGNNRREKELLGGKLLLRRHHNKGAMLNLGTKRSAAVKWVSVCLAIVLTAVFLFSLGRRGNHLLRAGLALLLGGAFSNTYDRLKRGFVVDYVSFGVKWKPLRSVVFNISDFCIIIGAFLSVIGATK